MSQAWEKHKKPTLLILAAGMGSRYGGLKQIDPVGPHGQIIIDYSMYDALAAGFGKVVFVIRHYFEDAFRQKIASKLEGKVETAYAYQELDSCLGDFQVPPNREKPWGTAHAILVARDLIDEPFAVINADDYYGTNAFSMLKNYLSRPDLDPQKDYSMVGYILENTLSEYGTVSRGICRVGENMMLQGVTECTKIQRTSDELTCIDENGNDRSLSGDEIVSMNLWGFQPSIFDHLTEQFHHFLSDRRNDLKAEFFIPTVVDRVIRRREARVKVLTTQDSWFGVTYREDRDMAVKCINRFIKNGIYSEKLW